MKEKDKEKSRKLKESIKKNLNLLRHKLSNIHTINLLTDERNLQASKEDTIDKEIDKCTDIIRLIENDLMFGLLEDE